MTTTGGIDHTTISRILFQSHSKFGCVYFFIIVQEICVIWYDNVDSYKGKLYVNQATKSFANFIDKITVSKSNSTLKDIRC